jgi:hypothetical protein
MGKFLDVVITTSLEVIPVSSSKLDKSLKGCASHRFTATQKAAILNNLEVDLGSSNKYIKGYTCSALLN